MSLITLDKVSSVIPYVKEVISNMNKNHSDDRSFDRLNKLIEDYENKYKDNIAFFRLIKQGKRMQDWKVIAEELKRKEGMFPMIFHEDINRLEETVKNEFERFYRYPQYQGDSINKLCFMDEKYLQEIYRIISSGEKLIINESAGIQLQNVGDSISLSACGETLYVEIKCAESFPGGKLYYNRSSNSTRLVIKLKDANRWKSVQDDLLKIRKQCIADDCDFQFANSIYYEIVDRIYCLFLLIISN